MKQTKPLTPKQDSFCVHYTTIGAETFSNGTKSAIAAGYSEKGAYVRASELLRNRKVLDRISELHTENMQRNMITVDKVLRLQVWEKMSPMPTVRRQIFSQRQMQSSDSTSAVSVSRALLKN